MASFQRGLKHTSTISSPSSNLTELHSGWGLNGVNGAAVPLQAGELSDVQLKQVSGGGLLSSPIGDKLRPPTTQWSGSPYQPVEDVEAY